METGLLLPRHLSTQPLRYIDPSGNNATGAVASFSWVTLCDGPLPFVDAIYGLTLATTTVVEYGPLVVEALFAKDDGEKKVKTTTDQKVPTKGDPNSVTRKVDENGKVISERHYDKDGRAEYDIHHTDHGNPVNHPHVPHRHDWTWNGDIPNMGDGLPLD